jgi:hypothetical protein
MKYCVYILAFISITAHAQNPQNQKNTSYEIQDYLVLSGVSKHTNNAPAVIQKWNEYNYGLGWQRSFKPIGTDYRYAVEGGFFEESFGKQSIYAAGSWLKDFTQSPRLSVGFMAGATYRVTNVKDGYYKIYPLAKNGPHIPVPVYNSRQLLGMAGFVAQLEIPNTPAVIQTTYIPKMGAMASGVLFTQLLIKF